MLSLDGGTPSVTFDVHLEDGGVVDEPVDRGEGHGLIWKNPPPFTEGLIGGDQHGSALVAGTDELEEDAGFGLIFGDVGQVVEDQQMICVELGDGGFELQVTPESCRRPCREAAAPPRDDAECAGSSVPPARVR